MKKRIVSMLLAGVVAASVLLSGCGGKDAEKQLKYKTLGISQMESGDFAGAVENFQKALDESNGSIGGEELDLCYYKALAQYKAGNTTEALETVSGLVSYDKKNWEAYYLKGRLELAEGQSEDALGDFAKAVELNGSDIALYTNLYEDLLNAGMETEAAAYRDHGVAMKPSDAEDYYNLGNLFYLLEDYDSAETNLNAAKEKGYDQALLLLGQVYAAEDKLTEAQEAFASYMEKYPEDAAAINELGEVAMKTGDYKQALTYLEKALELASDSLKPAVLKNLTAAYEYNGQWEAALDSAKESLSLRDDKTLEREYEFLKSRVKGLNAKKSTETDTEDNAVEGEITDVSPDASDAQ